MYYVVFKDVSGKWRWTLRASNHEPIAVSSESYNRKADAEYGIQLTKSSSTAPVYDLTTA